MTQEVMQVCVPLTFGGTLPLGTTLIYAAQAPTDALGGGITVVGVNYSCGSAIEAASAPIYTVVKTTAGGSTVNGTVATVLGSAAWTAGTTRLGTLSTVFVDGGECLFVRAAQTAANANEPKVTCVIQYKMGR